MIPIDQFKYSMMTFAKANRFQIQALGSRKMTMLCQDVAIPGVGISYQESQEKSNRPTKVAVGENTEDITLTFILDGDYTARHYFEDWKNQIMIRKDNGQFTMGYFDDYKRSFEIWQLNEFQVRTHGVKIVDCYPTTISSIDFSSTAENTIGTFSVTLFYQYYEFM